MVESVKNHLKNKHEDIQKSLTRNPQQPTSDMTHEIPKN